MTLVLGALPVPPLALAGGTLIFAAFVVVLFFVLVYGYYTRRGSGISQTPYRRPDAPPEAPSELAHDTLADVRSWERGTAGHHRVRPEAEREPVDPGVAAALREWRGASRGASPDARRLEPPVAPEDHVCGPDSGPTVTAYLDLTSEPCRFAWQMLTKVAAEQPLRIAVRHLPLADVHPLSLPAAETLEAAGAQGRFFELLDRLAAAGCKSESELAEAAAAVVDDPERLRTEVADGRYRPMVIEHIRHATASGAHAVPELYIDGDQYNGVLARDVVARTLVRR
jgi:protein-disulfide isomerase